MRLGEMCDLVSSGRWSLVVTGANSFSSVGVRALDITDDEIVVSCVDGKVLRRPRGNLFVEQINLDKTRAPTVLALQDQCVPGDGCHHSCAGHHPRDLFVFTRNS